MAYFGRKDRSLEKKRRFKTFEIAWFCKFISNTSRTLLLLICFEDVQNFGFFGKRKVLFSNDYLKVFKNTKDGYFPLECLSNFTMAHAIFKRSKFEFLRKNMTLLWKNPWKTSGALIGIFYRDCVSDFHIASDFSKQSNFWFFWKNRCCFWKDLFFQNR